MNKGKLVILVYNTHRMKKLYEEILINFDGESVPAPLFHSMQELGKVIDTVVKLSTDLEGDING